MKKVVLITGSHGLVAPYTAKHLRAEYEVRHLTRNPRADNEYKWDLAEKYVDERALDNVSYIVHLSGQKFDHGRNLTAERKKALWDTRIGASEFLLSKLQERKSPLEAFVSATAIGYYSFTDDALAIDENGERSDSFAGELTVGWEAAADAFKTAGMAKRVVKLRVSYVLGKKGSYFSELKEQSRTMHNLPATIENKTYFPWIHADDMGGMFAYAVKNSSLEGVFNTPAPQRTSEEAILQLMHYAQTNNKDAFDSVDIDYDGQYLSTEKIIQAGYVFQFPEIKAAILDLMST